MAADSSRATLSYVDLKLFQSKLGLSCLLLVFACNVTAQIRDASCNAVVDAIAELRKQPWVLLRGTVTNGTHPDGYKVMTSMLLNGKHQVRVLDGVRFATNEKITSQDDLDRVTGAADLLPDTDCIRSTKIDSEPSELSEYSYKVLVARSEANYRMSISRISGLPIRVVVEGPQLSYGRSLSRPGKPPQAVLKPNGLRYTEILEYGYGESVVRTESNRYSSR
jgi:hypothetical protein